MVEKYKDTFWRLVLVLAMSFVMSLMLFIPANAADYNCGAYGRGTYNNGQVCAAATSEEEASEEGDIVNTGQAMSIAIPALALIAGTAMLYRLSRKKKTNR